MRTVFQEVVASLKTLRSSELLRSTLIRERNIERLHGDMLDRVREGAHVGVHDIVSAQV